MIVFRLLGKAYRFVWSHTLHRPWTYAIRELTHKSWWSRLLAVAIYLGILVPPLVVIGHWWQILLVVAGYFFAFAAGHIWWDTAGEYIKYQSDFIRRLLKYG